MKRKKILALALVLSFLVLMVGCSTPEASSSEETNIVITDAIGRTIELDGVPEKAVATGWGTLRLYSYIADLEKLVGIEEIEKKNAIGRPYNYANPQFADLPTIGAGGLKMLLTLNNF